MDTKPIIAEAMQISEDAAAHLVTRVEKVMNKMSQVVPDCPSFGDASIEDVVSWAVHEHLQEQKIFNNAMTRRQTAKALQRLKNISFADQ